jgi:hypothetical protein
MSDNGGPVTTAEGDNYQVAVESQDVIPQIRYYYNIPQGSVVHHLDVHKLKLTIVAFACATKNISTIEKAPKKFRACAYNFKDLLGKLKRANMITAAIETELKKPIRGCNKSTIGSVA